MASSVIFNPWLEYLNIEEESINYIIKRPQTSISQRKNYSYQLFAVKEARQAILDHPDIHAYALIDNLANCYEDMSCAAKSRHVSQRMSTVADTLRYLSNGMHAYTTYMAS